MREATALVFQMWAEKDAGIHTHTHTPTRGENLKMKKRFLQMSEGFQWIKQTPVWKGNRGYQIN